MDFRKFTNKYAINNIGNNRILDGVFLAELPINELKHFSVQSKKENKDEFSNIIWLFKLSAKRISNIIRKL